MAGHVERAGVRQHFEGAGYDFFPPGVRSGNLRRLHGERRHDEHIALLQGAVVGRGQGAGQILRLGVIAAVVALLHVAPHHHHHLDGLGQVVGARQPATCRGVEQAGRIVALPVRTHASALDHQPRRPLGRNAGPDVAAVTVPRQGDRLDRGAQLLEGVRGLFDAGVHVGLRLVPAEPFLHDTEPQPGHVAVQRPGVRLAFEPGPLARVQSVRPGQHLQQQRGVVHGARHRAGVVQREFDRHDAGVWHQPIRRFVAVDAAPARGHADRAALISADRHVHRAGGDQCATAARRAARGPAGIVGIAHRAGRTGVAAAGKAQILAYRLAENAPAGVQNARNDRRVDFGRIALQNGAAVHHRHAGDAHVVLDGEGLAGQRAGLRALDVRAPVPGAERIVFGFGPGARGARIGDRQARFGQFVQPGIGFHHPRHETLERFQVILCQAEPKILGNVRKVVERRVFDRHRAGLLLRMGFGHTGTYHGRPAAEKMDDTPMCSRKMEVKKGSGADGI